jgi:hypothetical protein
MQKVPNGCWSTASADRCLETAGGGTAVQVASGSRPIETTSCPQTSGERGQGAE